MYFKFIEVCHENRVCDDHAGRPSGTDDAVDHDSKSYGNSSRGLEATGDVLPASAAAVPDQASGPVVRYRKASVQDQANMIGGEAFSFLCPVDWKMEGGVVWRDHPAMPATVISAI